MSDNNDLCCVHYVECLDCMYCCPCSDLKDSLLCKYHLQVIICCVDCIRIINQHNQERLRKVVP